MADIRLIDANALKEKFINIANVMVKHDFMTYAGAMEDAAKTAELQPAIEAEPVRHGRWEWYEEPITSLRPDPDYGWRCSHCKEDAAAIIQKTFPISNVEFDNSDVPPKFDYCPNCGAKMDEENG